MKVLFPIRRIVAQTMAAAAAFIALCSAAAANYDFDKAWKERIGSPITDTGNALTPEEARAFGEGIDLDALWAYMIAVGKNTRRVIGEMDMKAMRSMAREETVMRILEEGGVTADFRSVWLLVFWGRLTGAEMILTPLTMHHLMHLPALTGEFI